MIMRVPCGGMPVRAYPHVSARLSCAYVLGTSSH